MCLNSSYLQQHVGRYHGCKILHRLRQLLPPNRVLPRQTVLQAYLSHLRVGVRLYLFLFPSLNSFALVIGISLAVICPNFIE